MTALETMLEEVVNHSAEGYRLPEPYQAWLALRLRILFHLHGPIKINYATCKTIEEAFYQKTAELCETEAMFEPEDFDRSAMRNAFYATQFIQEFPAVEDGTYDNNQFKPMTQLVHELRHPEYSHHTAFPTLKSARNHLLCSPSEYMWKHGYLVKFLPFGMEAQRFNGYTTLTECYLKHDRYGGIFYNRITKILKRVKNLNPLLNEVISNGKKLSNGFVLENVKGKLKLVRHEDSHEAKLLKKHGISKKTLDEVVSKLYPEPQSYFYDLSSSNLFKMPNSVQDSYRQAGIAVCKDIVRNPFKVSEKSVDFALAFLRKFKVSVYKKR